ncbi:MAG TPA: hypothetical protein VE093_46160 [Polyangiaceae bacterium]|jgi:hypothetical protein|nr:hypothetical protein [Polyangiaceae bacterium]
MPKYLLANNMTTELFQLDSNRKRISPSPAGYAFAFPKANGTQEQRWLLHPGYKPPSGGKKLELRPASPQSEFQCKSQEDWTTSMADRWTEGATYVKVTYAIRDIEEVLKELTHVARLNLQVSDGCRVGVSLYKDSKKNKIAEVFGTNRERDPKVINKETNMEYWVLEGDYVSEVPAGSRMILEQVSPLQETALNFLADLNNDWNSKTLVVANCSYFTDKPFSF